jgi:ethanolamine utilization protein EutA
MPKSGNARQVSNKSHFEFAKQSLRFLSWAIPLAATNAGTERWSNGSGLVWSIAKNVSRPAPQHGTLQEQSVSFVTLIGLDFGTTTSSAVVARAKLVHNTVIRRTELTDFSESFRSPMTLTPIANDCLHEAQAVKLLEGWLAAAVRADEPIFGGGALLTGLTAQAENAAVLVNLIRERIGDAVVARADDPRRESWLAFMGSCAPLSLRYPDLRFINLDIGGGTSNLALGANGEVLATGCLFVGARHVQVEPGTYRIQKLSAYARRLLQYLGIAKDHNDELSPREVKRILDCYLEWLVAAVTGDDRAFASPIANLHQQVAFAHEARPTDRITLSGGVGELVYAAVRGHGFPGTTAFGDLGIDLAERLLNHSPWADDFSTFIPEGGGRATSFGLLRHSTQISGSTLFLSPTDLLPLRDVPILGTIDSSMPADHWQALLQLLNSSSGGGCLQIRMADTSVAAVRNLGGAIADGLEAVSLPPERPLIVIVASNVGKALGHYITRWGTRPRTLVVIDEIPLSDARFVHLGRLHDGVVPVSFYGLQT